MSAQDVDQRMSGVTEARVVRHDGDTWRVLSTGALRADGAVYCHLASTTRFRHQANGQVPIQISDWVLRAVIASPIALAS